MLFSVEPDSQRYPASLTKVMTLYIVFQELKAGRLKLNSPLTASHYSAGRPPSRLGLKAGEKITVENAIKALVTRSANDVAATIGENISGSEKAFAVRMTKTARALGMTRSTFRNASGLPDSRQVTTARDMATLSLRIQRDFPQYYPYFRIASFTYKGTVIRTHNRLLGRFAGTDGIKTGYINASGFNLTSSVARSGKRLVGVVMGARTGASRNKYMMTMLEKQFRNASTSKNNVIAAMCGTPPGYKGDPVPVVADLTDVPRPAQKPVRRHGADEHPVHGARGYRSCTQIAFSEAGGDDQRGRSVATCDPSAGGRRRNRRRLTKMRPRKTVPRTLQARSQKASTGRRRPRSPRTTASHSARPRSPP